MGTIANAKVTHYYNCYNGDFIGCLLPTFPGGYHQHCFVSSRYPLITVLTSDLTLVFLWASACITTFGSGDFTSWKKVSSKSFAF